MIVSLCNKDLLALVNDEQVVVGDLILRTTTESVSIFRGDPNDFPRRDAASAQSSNARQPKAKRAPKPGQRWIKARFPSRCQTPGCPQQIAVGDLILYDGDKRAPYCEAHGEQFFPNVPKPEKVNA